MDLPSPRVRYVPDWSGGMRQVAVFPPTSPAQTFKLAYRNRDPYGVWPSTYGYGYGLPYRGYLGPYGPSSFYSPYSYPYGYGYAGQSFLPPQVSPWVGGHGHHGPHDHHGPHGHHHHDHHSNHEDGNQGFSCSQGDCGYKSYGKRAATQSFEGMPVKPSMIEAEIEDFPVEIEDGDEEKDWPLSFE